MKDGPANQSYGLQVAQLAGVPKNVIAQAKKKLISLEKSSVVIGQRAAPVEGQNLALSFGAAPEPRDEVAEQVKAELEAVDPDELTPRQALDELYRLRGLLK